MLKLLSCARGHFWESAETDAGESPCCPECGAPADSLPLLDLEPSPASPPLSPAPADLIPAAIEQAGHPVVPGYEVLEELPRGRTGIRRFRARQPLVQREVLLEVVLAREDPTQRAWSSLRSEAGTLGKLRHPNLLTLLEAGERDRQLFYNAVERVEGPTLEERIAERLPSVVEALRLVEILARAVEHAHRQGVLHRHLEPAIVLLQPVGAAECRPAGDEPDGAICPLHRTPCRPRIAGFGLARRPIEGDPTDAELYVQPGFLSPEQAWGRTKELGPATDVYGLGGILYWLLTGRPPFTGTTLGDIIDAIQTADLPPPSSQRRVASDVEWVCLKALARHPRQRYPSAAALADDLRRVTLHLPPASRPRSATTQIALWARRRPALAAVLVLTVLGIVGTLVGYRVGLGRRTLRGTNPAHLERQHADVLAQLLAMRQQLGEFQRQARLVSSWAALRAAGQALETGDPGLALQHLQRCSHADRHFEWYHLMRQVTGKGPRTLSTPAGRSLTLAFHPTNPRVLAHAVREGEENPRGSKVLVLDLPSRRITFSGHFEAGPVQGLAFSPDGHSLAAAGGDRAGELVVFSLFPGHGIRFRRQFPEAPVTAVAWSRDNSRIILATGNGQLHQIYAHTGATMTPAIGTTLPGGAGATRVVCRPDGQVVAGYRPGDREVRLWDLSRGTLQGRLGGRAGVVAAVHAPDQRLAVAWDDDSVHIYEAQSGEEVVRLHGVPRSVQQLAFSRAGDRLAVAGADRVRIWGKVGPGWQELLDLAGDASIGLAFSSTGRALATAGDREVAVWGAAGE